MTTIAATGHRPASLPTKYDITPLISLVKPYLAARKPDVVISGVALGWDQAVAIAAMDLGIPVTAMIPHIGQADAWPKPSHDAYQALLLRCTKRIVVSPGGYEVWKMQARNEAMVDACDELVALWDGEESGGTWNCVSFARSRAKRVTNLWSEYIFEL